MMRSRTSTALAVACGALVVVGAALGPSAPAQAHNYLVSSTPAADSTLTELPDEFEITTNDALLVTGDGSRAFALQVTDAAGAYYGDGCVTVDGATMTAEPALGEPGEYTALWQVVSADGHTVSDEFSFEWSPAGEADISNGAGSPPECGAEAAAGGPPVAESAATAASASDSSDALWLGGAGLAVLLAVGVTVFVVRRRDGTRVQ